MKIKKSVLEKLIREELGYHINGLTEAGPADDKKDAAVKDKKSSSPEKKPPAPKPPAKKPAQKLDKPADANAEEVPDEKEPADDKIAADTEEDDDNKEGGKISDEIMGKRIQSITLNPKSKLVPGAKEIVVTFDEIPDPFKILITSTGEIRYFFKGLHNEL